MGKRERRARRLYLDATRRALRHNPERPCSRGRARKEGKKAEKFACVDYAFVKRYRMACSDLLLYHDAAFAPQHRALVASFLICCGGKRDRAYRIFGYVEIQDDAFYFSQHPYMVCAHLYLFDVTFHFKRVSASALRVVARLYFGYSFAGFGVLLGTFPCKKNQGKAGVGGRNCRNGAADNRAYGRGIRTEKVYAVLSL